MTSNPVLQVSVLNTRHDFFDYLMPDIKPAIGTRVWVPFRSKQRLGIVVGHGVPSSPDKVLKPIADCIDDEPVVSDPILHLCRWISTYYQTSLSEVLALALPKRLRLGNPYTPCTEMYYQLTVSANLAHQTLSPQAKRQHALIDLFATEPCLSKAQITQAGFSSVHRRALMNQGLLQLIEQPLSRPGSTRPLLSALTLNDEQAQAVDRISASLNQYQCFLIQGVTGSGKTEIYLQIIAKVLATGKQVLVLVPEIGLTPQLLTRFTARFDQPMAILHSNLSDQERLRAWQLAKESMVKLIIGTRGAVFTPLPDLGLIVIDEEHDASLKQMDRVRYSGRDTALMRAYMKDVPILLGSATPSLESLHNAHRQKYILLRLNHKAVSRVPLRYQLLDIRSQPLCDGIAPQTLALIGEHLARQHQVLVFINRRGYSPILLCHQCGWMADCRACDSHLTLHRHRKQLVCHHCGQTQAIPSRCQSCQCTELLPIGAGTQRVADYLSQQFPATTVLRVDRDEVQKKQAINDRLDQIHRGEAQLIVGTQMLAKGHHFPNLTLVVVLDADNGFYNQDFRALERLGQLLTQVAGRAGREEHPGHVLIQTHLPQHPLLNLLVQQGYDEFAEALLNSRLHAQLPPFSHIALLRAQSRTQAQVLSFLHAIKKQLHAAGIDSLGPAPAPLARKAEQHRMQLLLKAPSRQKREHALTHLRESIRNHQLDKKIEWTIDVDPIDLS